ncbi:phosphoribosylanthranilate isomerase [Pseudoxanthomonas indica]|uniref:N-(5'-phosphoribosyl)anthranilate isomerase n=1 Tax=Pseudoxanthomonas indica TaxID=428993 RepID=A0A1T5J0C6_9GAMM|nr:phosphoribosylanthranilate isomerase [Pseudoxanthomonas indica]GGD55332.1 N-(5'-phosphoribosyl)anthranilate isomerase [Pseudoxanthomonas indica]SKC44648.1 phosphoribosylanthranilate isomerase [Pseudoxanthomonas indica]
MPTRIKFCGLTRGEDVRAAIELGVDYLGLVFAARSPRRLLIGQARMLRELVPEEIGVVALVMDNGPIEVQGIVEHVRPDLLQFHGSEDDGFCAGFGVPYWKAIAMGGAEGNAFAAMAGYPGASGFLFDGHGAGEQGGSGKRFDWKQTPQGLDRPFLLAGGLSPENVGVAICTAHPWGVDVSSGIESAPGIKDAEKMRLFVEAVRHADQG